MWSPDGRYLAYRHTNCDGPEDAWRHVVISDREGNVLAQFPGDGWDISWSPDSTRVAVWVTVFETIGVFGLDGERQALVTMPRGWRPSGDHDPMWLADGESLVLQGVVIPIDGSAPYHLQFDGTYSPDGSRVVYVAGRSLVVAEADGSNPRVVFDDWVSNPVWSPTGNRIAFTSKKPGSATVNELRVLDVASGTVTLLAEADGSELETEAYFLLSVIDFSPEGDRILFARTEDGDSLWSINVDGSDHRRLVAGTAWGDWLSPGPTR
jgi:TolB protein